MGEGGQVRRHQGGLIWSCEGPLLLLPACGEKVGMRGRGRCLSVGRGLRRQRFIRDAQNRGEAPSPSLRSTSPRTRGEVFFRHCEERSDEAIQRASPRSQAALDCFALLAMTTSIVLALRFLRAPRVLPTMSRNGPPQGEAERRKARSQRPRSRTSGAPLEFALDRGARRFWRTRSPSRALPRLSPGFQAWLSPVPRFMVATTCATRAASSWQTGVEASRASFRTARG